MKTHKELPDRFGALRICCAATLLALVTCCLSLPSYAQLPAKEAGLTQSQPEPSEEAVMQMGSFTGHLVDGVVYLKWTMRGESASSLFIIERSLDGETYEALGSKEGYGVPRADMELLYCFSDMQPENGISIYRIKQLRTDGVLYSHAVEIRNEQIIPLVDLTKQP